MKRLRPAEDFREDTQHIYLIIILSWNVDILDTEE